MWNCRKMKDAIISQSFLYIVILYFNKFNPKSGLPGFGGRESVVGMWEHIVQT